MGEGSAVPVFAFRKRGDEFDDSLAEIDGEHKDRAQLNDDCVHLPVATIEVDAEKRFSQAQVSAVELTGRNSVRPSTMPRITEST